MRTRSGYFLAGSKLAGFNRKPWTLAFNAPFHSSSSGVGKLKFGLARDRFRTETLSRPATNTSAGAFIALERKTMERPSGVGVILLMYGKTLRLVSTGLTWVAIRNRRSGSTGTL